MIDAPLVLLVLRMLAVIVAVTLLRSRVLISAPTRDGLMLLALVAVFQPLWAVAAEGGPSAFQLLLVTAAVVAATRGWPVPAGALLAGALIIGLQPVLVFAVLFTAASPRPLLTALGVLATTAALFGAAVTLRPDVVAARLAASAETSASTLWGLTALLPEPTGTIAALAVTAVAVGAFAWWWRTARPLFESIVAAAVALSLLLAPRAELTDHLLLLLPAAVLLEHYAHRLSGGRPAAVTALAIVLGVLPWAAWLAVRATGIAPIAAAIPLLTFGLVLVAEQRTRSARGSAIEGEGAVRIG